MDWLDVFLSILAGLGVAIPLVIKLVEHVKIAAKERNWSEIVKLTLGLMTTAEQKFSDGASRKEWVMSMIQSSAKGLEYNMDDAAVAKISNMIDSICAAAKAINTPKQIIEIPKPDKPVDDGSHTITVGTLSISEIEGQCTFDE